MWVFLKNSFLSVTRNPEDERLLQVRGRLPGDIERVFPEADVVERPGREYRFGTSLKPSRVVEAVGLALEHIDYDRLGEAIEPGLRRELYEQVQHIMHEAQDKIPADDAKAL